MARIFLSAGHGGFENGTRDPGTVAGGTTEAREMILLRDLVVGQLRSRAVEVLAVPDELSQVQTIDWINSRSRIGDVALEIQASGASNPSVRGAGIFYIAANNQRKADAEMLIMSLLRRFPQLPNRGATPDTATGLGRLIFCRWVSIPSMLMELGFLTNPDDRLLIQNRRGEMAIGIADGLETWIRPRAEPPTPSPITYRSININLNGGIYEEQGVLINGNAYIPIDLVDRLGIDLSNIARLRRVSYKNIVYVQAIELRDFQVLVTWDNANRTVVLRSNIQPPAQVGKIMGAGITTEVQLIMFLRANNPSALTVFPDIAKLYREEARVEGVNYDIAFCQMCLETNFLRFGDNMRPTQNNFGGLATVGGDSESASFASARIGVRAHIQHLKAYASIEPLVQELVDPRFRFVTRGIAPEVDRLGGRWTADLQYGTKITALVRRLYELMQSAS
ncbi:MAG: cell wall hydrolase [Oscillatoriales cyanobacterium]|uniref:N-acetylmuramoyl-L-alanine amidase n=1 Tax=Microcoleus anatoxicus PTRS2 TaxID=2705321 RepID=A0ABU8YNB4_9CYAN|nr:MAG: cell wall hydrolase [Oscillatoriales cyanobacterium]TAD95879.1 MAG: cell wall hydrolase [Oscillatoriales cyanobacterium]TAE04320.1 MAG: cell wall hydrolase [Oscillatoriales cyanobacterium]TAE98655.1 MAG: cell wall hydrolase [Oscillatoriales cyanobacterium]TAF31970.1 MAG: cell wall hydrolase [Oscillatoriales cyanobacterium]